MELWRLCRVLALLGKPVAPQVILFVLSERLLHSQVVHLFKSIMSRIHSQLALIAAAAKFALAQHDGYTPLVSLDIPWEDRPYKVLL